MARKHKNSSSLSIIGLAVFVLILVGVLLFSKNLHSQSNFAQLTTFPTKSYLNGDALWNNAEYVIRGSFQNILVQPNESKSLFCSVVDDEAKLPLPIIFTDNAAKKPLEPEQKILLKVKVRSDGAIIATDCAAQ